VYVCEGSHCGIVPMNHSNKDGTSSAESEEGRLRIKENAGQSSTIVFELVFFCGATPSSFDADMETSRNSPAILSMLRKR
jgi:hypothetical protein